jgi:CCR4-NOT transcription complex subunit 1
VKPETEILKEKLNGWFMQWVSIYQRSPLPEKSFVSFITQLSSKGVLKGDEMSSLFLRVCAESSVTSYMKCIAAGQDDYAFQALDATSKLIVYMIKYQGDAMDRVNNDTAKVHYLTKILSIFILVLANFHEDQGIAFQQKPFFRFFSSLISDLHAIEADLGQVSFHLLIAVRYQDFLSLLARFAQFHLVKHSVPFSQFTSLALHFPGCVSSLIAFSCRNSF